MRVVYQLGGNQRKDKGCKGCQKAEQQRIYTEQGVDNLDNAIQGLEMFDSWKTNSEVRQYMLRLLELIINLLGVQREVSTRVTPDGGEHEVASAEGSAAAA